MAGKGLHDPEGRKKQLAQTIRIGCLAVAGGKSNYDAVADAVLELLGPNPPPASDPETVERVARELRRLRTTQIGAALDVDGYQIYVLGEDDNYRPMPQVYESVEEAAQAVSRRIAEAAIRALLNTTDDEPNDMKFDFELPSAEAYTTDDEEAGERG